VSKKAEQRSSPRIVTGNEQRQRCLLAQKPVQFVLKLNIRMPRYTHASDRVFGVLDSMSVRVKNPYSFSSLAPCLKAADLRLVNQPGL
jgi:hypothetical protein